MHKRLGDIIVLLAFLADFRVRADRKAVEGKPTRYVQKIHPPLIGLGLKADSFFHQDTIPLKGYPYEVRLILRGTTSG